MASVNPRRISGRLLQIAARADRLPVIGSGLRAATRPLLPLSDLRTARLGSARPYLVPQGPDDPASRRGGT